MTENPSDRLDPEIPNPDVPVDPDGDPESVPADSDVDPVADPTAHEGAGEGQTERDEALPDGAPTDVSVEPGD